MSLYDGKKETKDAEKNKKIKKMILVLISIVCFLIVMIIAFIIFIQLQPKELSVSINGKVNNKLLEKLNISIDEKTKVVKLDKDNKPILYGSIKELAPFFGYDGNNGNYMTVSEDTNYCNVKNENEVAIFTLDSNIVYKKVLNNPDSNYETYQIEEKVIKHNNQLYTNTEGLELAYNIFISYNTKMNSIDIYTLDYYVTYYTTRNATKGTTPIEDLGYSELDESFVNQKAILQGMLVVKDGTGTYGVIDSKANKIFSTQYDSLTYLPQSDSFLIESDSKYGIITIKGETKIKPVYSTLQLIDNEKQLYLVSENNKYGIIDINSNIIVPLEYDNIGIDITQFAENNITNGYIIQNKLIPVEQDGKWGFYNLNGKIIGEGIVYNTLGCITTSSIGTAYNLLSIPEHNLIVVSKEEKYGCINLDGKAKIPLVADDIYMQISAGETKYIMSRTKDGKIQTKNIADLMK